MESPRPSRDNPPDGTHPFTCSMCDQTWYFAIGGRVPMFCCYCGARFGRVDAREPIHTPDTPATGPSPSPPQ